MLTDLRNNGFFNIGPMLLYYYHNITQNAFVFILTTLHLSKYKISIIIKNAIIIKISNDFRILKVSCSTRFNFYLLDACSWPFVPLAPLLPALLPPLLVPLLPLDRKLDWLWLVTLGWYIGEYADGHCGVWKGFGSSMISRKVLTVVL